MKTSLAEFESSFKGRANAGRYAVSSARFKHPRVMTKFDQLRMAADVLRQEAVALNRLAETLPIDFCLAVDQLVNCSGSVIVTGVGKAGWIGQKLSASLASTGTPSHFLHPTEAMHGDLGRVTARDLVLVLSNSGETAEVLQLLEPIKNIGASIVALTGNVQSTLATQAAVALCYSKTVEACPLNLAPTTSTTTMLGLGDALTLVVAKMRSFQAQDFALFHPGGSLGKKLANVEDVMRPLEECRVANETETVRDIYIRSGADSRRAGVVLILNDAKQLTGIFTDSDLARLLSRQQDECFDSAIKDVMTVDPVTVFVATKASEAIEKLARRNLSELPVVNSAGVAVGLVDITDVVGS